MKGWLFKIQNKKAGDCSGACARFIIFFSPVEVAALAAWTLGSSGLFYCTCTLLFISFLDIGFPLAAGLFVQTGGKCGFRQRFFFIDGVNLDEARSSSESFL